MKKIDEELQQEIFKECFFKDIESWFTAGLCGCGLCINNFMEEWPGVEKRDSNFQSSYMEVQLFYEGSYRLKKNFNQNQFNKYISSVECPECGNELSTKSVIYPYDLPIGNIRSFISNIKSLSEIILATPFLALTHVFAQKILLEIKQHADTTVPKIIENTLFRARRKELFSDINAHYFCPPPPEVTHEGRFNHAGMPVLYVASNKKTCIIEMVLPLEELSICEIKLTSRYKILDLTLTQIEQEENVLDALTLSKLFMSPRKSTGWNSPEYIFTRFIADCAKAAGFDCIAYPSSKTTEGHNIVFLNPAKIELAISILKFE